VSVSSTVSWSTAAISVLVSTIPPFDREGSRQGDRMVDVRARLDVLAPLLAMLVRGEGQASKSCDSIDGRFIGGFLRGRLDCPIRLRPIRAIVRRRGAAPSYGIGRQAAYAAASNSERSWRPR
jgi:hypothetical protein